MKKILILFLGMFFLQSVFSITVLNSQDEETEFFSLQSSLVKIETQKNISNLSISYNLLGNQEKMLLNFTNCGSNKCLNFDLIDLVENQNGSIYSSNNFNLSYGNDSKIIYLDIEKPSMDLNSYFINSSEKVLELNFSFFDNLSGIKKVELFEKNNNNLNIVDILTNKTNYNYNLEKQGNLTLLFKIEDKAGNIKEEEKNFTILDIFEPKINELILEKNNSQYSLRFEVEDENLQEYGVSKDGVLLSGQINTNNNLFDDIILVPFNSGDFDFYVRDSNGNEISQSLDLDENIDVKNLEEYINSEELSFNSNADSCKLISLDSNNRNENFDKSSSYFSVDLDISSNREYEVRFSCQKDFLIEYFSHDFILDTKSPSRSQLDSDARDNGDIYLNWTESTDNYTDLEYILYRDDSRIYRGSKLDFLDINTKFPNEYTYYIEVKDLADNSVRSNEIEIGAKKDEINLVLSIPEELTQTEKYHDLLIFTDIYSDVYITVLNDDEEIFSREYLQVSNTDLSVNLSLEEGINEIEVYVEDEFLNTNRKNFALVVENRSVIDEPVVNEQYLEIDEENSSSLESQSQNINTNGEEESSGFNWYRWIGILLILLLILVFIALIVHNHPELRQKVENKLKKRTHKMERSRKHDLMLGKSLQKAKEKRIQKQQEAKEKEEKKKKERPKSFYHSKKLEELSNRRQVRIPMETRQKASKKHKRKHKELKEEEKLHVDKKEDFKPKKSFFSKFKKSQEKPRDDFHDYLLKDSVKRRWDSSDSYRQKEEKPVEVKEENNSLEKEKTPTTNNNVKESKNQEVKRQNIDPFKRVKEQEKNELNILTSFFGRFKGKKSKESSKEKKSNKSQEDKVTKEDLKEDIINKKEFPEDNNKSPKENIKQEEKQEEKQVNKEDEKRSRKNEALDSLDSYLGKRVKKKRNYFAEKAVDEDLRRRG